MLDYTRPIRVTIYRILLGVLAFVLATGCALAPESVNLEAQHTSHVSQHFHTNIDAMSKLAQSLENLRTEIESETTHYMAPLTTNLKDLIEAIEKTFGWLADKEQQAVTAAAKGYVGVTDYLVNHPVGRGIGEGVWSLFSGGAELYGIKSLMDAVAMGPRATPGMAQSYNQVFASALDVPSWVQPAAGGGGAGTNVDIGTIIINTKATDYRQCGRKR